MIKKILNLFRFFYILRSGLIFTIFIIFLIILKNLLFYYNLENYYHFISPVIVVSVVLWLVKRFFNLPTFKSVGKILEEKFETKGILLNAFDFYEKKLKGEKRFNENLLSSSINKGEILLENLSYFKVFKIHIDIFLLIFLIFELIFLLNIKEMKKLKLSIKVIPGNVHVLNGKSVNIKVVGNRLIKSCQLVIIYSNKEVHIPMIKNSGNLYSFKFVVTENVKYFVIADDIKSSVYAIITEVPLKIEKIFRYIKTPDYIKALSSADEVKSLNVSVLKDSKIKYELFFNVKPDTVEVNGGNLLYRNDNKCVIEMKADFTKEISISAFKLLSSLELTGEIVIIKDKLPGINLFSPIDKQVVYRPGDLNIKADFYDDFGLKYIKVSLNLGDYTTYEIKNINAKNYFYTNIFRIDENEFYKSKHARILFSAKDINPENRIVSKEIKVFIASKFERLEYIKKVYNKLDSEIFNISNNIERLTQELNKIEKDNRFEDEVSIKTEKKLKALSFEIEKNRERLKKLLKRMEEIEKNTNLDNKILKEIIEKSQKIRKLLKNLLNKQLDDLIKKVKGIKSGGAEKIKFSEKIVLKKLNEILKTLLELQKEKKLELLEKQLIAMLNSWDELSKKDKGKQVKDLIKSLNSEEYPEEFKDIIKNYKNKLENDIKNSNFSNVKKNLDFLLMEIKQKKKELLKKRKNKLLGKTEHLIKNLLMLWYEWNNIKKISIFNKRYIMYDDWLKKCNSEASEIAQMTFLFPQTIFIYFMKADMVISDIINNKNEVFSDMHSEFNKLILEIIKELFDFYERLKKNRTMSNLDELRQQLSQIIKNQKKAMNMLKSLSENTPSFEMMLKEILKQQQIIRKAFSIIREGGYQTQEIMRQIEKIQKQLLEIEKSIIKKEGRKVILKKQKRVIDNMLKLERAFHKLKDNENKRKSERLDKTIHQLEPTHEINIYNKIKTIDIEWLKNIPEFYKYIFEK